jgi:hypothetical protein
LREAYDITPDGRTIVGWGVNAAGNTEAWIFLGAPAAPSNLVGTEFMKGVAKLTWKDNAIDETGFNIERQQRVGNSWVNTLIVATPPPNTTSYMESPGVGVWRYRVQAVRHDAKSKWSLYLAVKPARPTGLTAQKSNGSAQLNWTDASNFETKFDVQRSQKINGVWTTPTIIGTLGTDATSLLNSPGPGAWRYRIRSGSAAGSSLWTGWVNITLP